MPPQVSQWSKPRKTPVQRRSRVTVDAILEATIQVLLAEGLARLTTTRVSERAGVSVGTMYQYFPNKQALISWAYENAVVDGREDHEDGSVSLDLRLTARQADELDRKLGSGQKAQKEDWER